RARTDQSTTPGDARWMEQVKADAAAELHRRQVAWEAERQALQEQLVQSQAEQRRLQELAAPESMQSQAAGFGDQRLLEALRQQLEQERQQRRALEEEMKVRIHKAEQERGALETEI
ncbi:hypothetical protein RZS08_42090, partial [Arthrospira platensis SPKY1]|nr:hypothetical protein [Arthrospira platensis SPKY1]